MKQSSDSGHSMLGAALDVGEGEERERTSRFMANRDGKREEKADQMKSEIRRGNSALPVTIQATPATSIGRPD